MCGICGTTAAGYGRTIEAMNALMRHRGPDDEGIFLDRDSDVGLGARRLSVIDVEGGHQPLQNEDGTVTTVLNGEIYNFRSLRERLLALGHRLRTETDAEVLVHLYEDYGSDLVHALEGMYAFAIWDARRRRLLLARDRFGEKPLFYLERDGELTFASELTALRAGVSSRLELDPASLDTYFTFGYVVSPGTMLQGVLQLPPGHLLEWDPSSGRGAVRSYWSPPAPERPGRADLREAVDEAEALLDASVRSRLVADVPVGVFLSGGVDSTLLTALAARHSSRLKSFTVTYDVGSTSEAGPARRAAEVVGSDHHEYVLTGSDVAERAPRALGDLDQPLADQAFVALQALSEFARPQITVAVGGEGADEVFGGYPRYRWLARSVRLAELVPRQLLVSGARIAERAPLTGAATLGHLLRPGTVVHRHLGWVTGDRPSLRPALYGPLLREYVDRRPDLGGWDGAERDGVEGRFMRLDQLHWLPDDVLAKADRASMQASLEMRTPYLHREVVELAASVPPRLHAQNGGKAVLRAVLDRVLPSAPSRTRKAAFLVPAAEWLRGPLRPLLREQLRSSALYEDGWFERAGVAVLADDHISHARDWTKVLWPIFALGIWLDRHERGLAA